MNPAESPEPTIPVPGPSAPLSTPPPPPRRSRVFTLIIASVLVVTVLIGVGVYGAYRVASNVKRDDTKVTDGISPSTSPVPTPSPTTSPKATGGSSSSSGSSTTSSSIKSVLASINAKLKPYGVTATVKPADDKYGYVSWKELSGSKTDLTYLQQFSTYLTDEYTKLPTDLVKASKLKTIGLVKDLAVTGTNRATSYMYYQQAMVYDPQQEVSAGEPYARQTITHEYWHYLDYALTGSDRPSDTTWAKCNPSDFTYGDGGETAYTETNFVNTFYPQKAFITHYATYSMAEDRAETFSWLMYSPKSVTQLHDAGIDCKVKRITKLVHQFSPSMTF